MAASFNTIVDETARVAVSLEGAREALQANRRHLENGNAQQSAVAQLGRRALDRAPLPDLLHEAVRLVQEVLNVPLTSIFELSTDGTSVRLTYGAGWSTDAMGSTVVHIPSSPMGVALHGLQPVVIDDLTAPGPDLQLRPVWVDRGARSGAWVPISTMRQQTFGVLAVHATEIGRFSQDDVHFLEGVANVLGSAIERTRNEEQLAYQAVHDPLTNLPNRVLFVDRLTSALGRLKRHRGALAVLFLDIDRFKLVNDGVGHVRANEVLIEVATRLRMALRAGDTLARFGGDEFVVLCEDVIDEADALLLADRLTEFTRGPIMVGGTEHLVTLSTGVAFTSSHTTLVEDLLRDADAAMYQAKESGRAQVSLFAESLRAKALHRVDTETSLRHALAAGDLSVHYQPVVDVATGMITGFEALARWKHPSRGLVHPIEFIPVAEESGLIVPLGEFVLGESTRQLRRWQEEFPQYSCLDMAVNLSARQLIQNDLTAVVANILDASDLDPCHLVLEITESVLMRDTKTSVTALRDLAALGVRVGIDDFGTGYSSLAYLKKFSADVLKIDKTFIDGLGTDPQDAAIVAATITLAGILGMHTIAEGVEHQHQLDELQQMGCDSYQGYLFARPGPADEIHDLLSRTTTTHSGVRSTLEQLGR